MGAVDNAQMFEALDTAAIEVRLGIELAKQAQSGHHQDADIPLCTLHYIEKHLLNAQAALQAAGAH